MDPFRFRTLIAPAMASLFLLLSLCAFVAQGPVSVGMNLPVLQVRDIPSYDCPGVDRSIYVQLHKDGSYWINETQVPANELRFKLSEIYEYRKEKYILMFPDTDVSYGEFANFYNVVSSSTSNLHIILRTRQLQAQLNLCPPFGSCGLDWPDHTYLPCVYHPPLDLVPSRRVVDPVS
jgi:biopolymer transport protein ExbD